MPDTHGNPRYVSPYTPTVDDKVEAVAYWRSGGPGYGTERMIVGEIRKVNRDGSVEIEFTDRVGTQRIKRHRGDFGVLR